MKNIIGLFALLLGSLAGYGQAQEGRVEYQKVLQPAAVIELPYPSSVVNAAMNDYLSKKGKSKGDDIKGFTLYRNTQTVTGDSSNADLYFKTERKSRKEKDVTVVSLLIIPVDAQTNEGNLYFLDMEEGKNYLNDLAKAIDAYNLELSIKSQNDVVIQAEAKYKKLTSEADDLEKRRTDIDKRIADNKNDQQQQLKEIENQKKILAKWVSQRQF